MSERGRALPEHVKKAIALGRGLPHESPVGRARAAAVERGGVSLLEAIAPASSSNIRPRGRSKLQAAYALELEALLRLGQLVDVHEEAVSLRLADRTWIRPDFVVRTAAGELQVHEVKGHWEDDARAKIKMAAETFAIARWFAVTRRRGTWTIEPIPGPRERRPG